MRAERDKWRRVNKRHRESLDGCCDVFIAFATPVSLSLFPSTVISLFITRVRLSFSLCPALLCIFRLFSLSIHQTQAQGPQEYHVSLSHRLGLSFRAGNNALDCGLAGTPEAVPKLHAPSSSACAPPDPEPEPMHTEIRGESVAEEAGHLSAALFSCQSCLCWASA